MDTINWQSVRHQFIWQSGRLKPGIPLTQTRLAILLLGFVAIWGLLWLGITTQTVVVGQRVRDLDVQLDQTLRQNAQLEYDIAALLEPDRVIKRATALGMRPAAASQTIYLDIKYPLRGYYVPEKKSGDLSGFDWTKWIYNALGGLGLGSSAGSADTGQ